MNNAEISIDDKGLVTSNHQAMVDYLANAIGDLPPVSVEPNHYFAHGTYTRELFIPKNTVIAGKIHRYDCIAIIPYGHVSVVTDDGSYEIKGPQTLVTGSGSKAVFAHEDTLWITVHPWNGEPDVDAVEDYVIVKHNAELKRIMEV